MNNIATQSISQQEFEAAARKSAEVKQYITFKVSGHLLALPSAGILKVVATPPPNQGGLVSMGLVQLGPYSIQIIELHKLLPPASRPSQSEGQTGEQNPPFLLVLRDTDGEFWGIALNEPPDLIDMPNYALKPVPHEKRLARALRWISHVVTYHLHGNSHTLLLLDIPAVLGGKRLASPTLQAIDPISTGSDSAPIPPKTNDEASGETIQTVRELEMYA